MLFGTIVGSLDDHTRRYHALIWEGSHPTERSSLASSADV
jgi:hypothetical protein